MSELNYLVVGVNGTIGSALFSRLQRHGLSVCGTTQRREAAEQERVFYVNLLDPSTWVFDRKFDVVYFCAGMCRMALCEDDPETTYKVNVEATLALSRQLSDQGALIVFLSTNQVFSGAESSVSAGASYEPINEYGRQKAAIEVLLKKHCPRLAIVRLTKVVEPGMQLIDGWIKSLSQGQSVNAFHDMMLAPVTLRQVVSVLIGIGAKSQTGIFQISGACDISYYDLAKYLTQILGCPEALVNSISALDVGMRKTFLPRFTTLDCSSIITSFKESPPQYAEVIQESFDLK